MPRRLWAKIANWPKAKKARTSSVFHAQTPLGQKGNWPRVAKSLGKTSCFDLLAHFVAQGGLDSSHTFELVCWVVAHCSHCTHPPCNALHLVALQCTSLQCIALHCRSLQCNARRCSAMHATRCNDATTGFVGEPRRVCAWPTLADRGRGWAGIVGRRLRGTDISSFATREKPGSHTCQTWTFTVFVNEIESQSH